MKSFYPEVDYLITATINVLRTVLGENDPSWSKMIPKAKNVPTHRSFYVSARLKVTAHSSLTLSQGLSKTKPMVGQ